METLVEPQSAPMLPESLIHTLLAGEPLAGLEPAAFAAADAVREALSHVLRRVVTFGPARPERATSIQDARIALTLRAGSEFTLTLDLSASRALVDALEHEHCGLRGVGELTPTEEGALEYLALAVLDELDVLAPLSAPLLLSKFESGSELRRRLACARSRGYSLALEVGHSTGTVTLWLPSENDAVTTGFARPATSSAAKLEVACALAALELDEAEIAALKPGVVVLLGRTAVTGGATLVSSNGWELAGVELEFDGPGVSRARCAALTPRSLSATLPAANALATLGETFLDRAALRMWHEGQVLDLPKSSRSPARLVLREGRTFEAELVGVAGELGLRLLREAAPSA